MRSFIVKSHSYLSQSHRISKRTTSGHDDDPTGAGCQSVDPILQTVGVGKAAAELDDDWTVTAHLPCRFRIGFADCRIKMVDLGHFRGLAAHNLNAGSAWP